MVRGEIVTAGVEDYFASSIEKSLVWRKLELSPRTRQYLVQMLTSFVRLDQLFNPREIGGKLRLEPISVQYFRALSERGLSRKLQLRKVGDECLFLTGYCYDFLSSAGKGQVQFRRDIGVSAYLSLAQGDIHDPHNLSGVNLYQELARKFPDISAVVSDLHLPELDDPKNVVRLYEHWQQTNDTRYGEALIACGFLPPKPLLS